MKNSKNKRTAKSPILRFSPTSWAKLIFMRDRGNTEVGGFGVCFDDDLLRVDDFQLVKQSCSQVTVEFDDASVADFFDRQVDAGLSPRQFARIWVHTHPGNCARPSGTDEATFARVFGGSDWAVMFILAEAGQVYARLQFNVGPGGSLELPVEIDYALPFAAADWQAWEQEYLANVQSQDWFEPRPLDDSFPSSPDETLLAWRDAWHAYSDDEFMEISAYERF